MLPRDHADRRWIHRGERIGRALVRIRNWFSSLIENMPAAPSDWHL